MSKQKPPKLCTECHLVMVSATRKDRYKRKTTICEYCEGLARIPTQYYQRNIHQRKLKFCEVCKERLKEGITGMVYCPNGHSHKNLVTHELVIDQPVSGDEGVMTLQVPI